MEADTSIDQLMEDALRDNAFIAPPEDDLDSQGIEDRRLVILTSVIHKKAISKTNSGSSKDSSDEIILPHLDDISIRSKSKRIRDSDSVVEDIEEGLLDKDDIVVESIRTSTHQSLRGSMIQQESSDDLSTFYSPKSCPICLERYKKGDEICWSQNVKCHHAYHLQCILEWLLHSNECPLCRVDYLNQTSADLNQTTEQPDLNQTTEQRQLDYDRVNTDAT